MPERYAERSKQSRLSRAALASSNHPPWEQATKGAVRSPKSRRGSDVSWPSTCSERIDGSGRTRLQPLIALMLLTWLTGIIIHGRVQTTKPELLPSSLHANICINFNIK
jgi:hypothetical protein